MKKLAAISIFLFSCTAARKTTLTLDGSKSYDPDGKIVMYRWSQVSGPAAAIIEQPDSVKTKVVFPVKGMFTFQLFGKDDKGATGTDYTIKTIK